MHAGMGRFSRRLLSLTILFAAIVVCAWPASAHAEAWLSEYPYGAIRSAPSLACVDVFGTTLNARTAVMTVDGVSQRTFVSQGTAAGHWESQEKLINGVYMVKWSWVADLQGPTKATVSCYPIGLADGDHTVLVFVKDVTGVAMSYSWSFTARIAPVFGATIPAAGTTVDTLTPTITVPVSDNVAIASVSATVNGVAASASYDGSKVIVTGFTLKAGGNTVAVGATDPSGNSAAKTWSFKVATASSCALCHVGYASDPMMGPDCASCHPDAIASRHAPSHAGTDAAVRVIRTPPSSLTSNGGCSDTPGVSIGCHDISDLSKLHEGLADGGCSLCHGSGKSPKSECLDCHKEGAATDTMPLGTSVYHHLNAKYLFNPAEVREPGQKYFLDSNAQPYFRSRGSDAQGNYWSVDGYDSPPSGWAALLFDVDCATACHLSQGSREIAPYGSNGVGHENEFGNFTDTSPVWTSGPYPTYYEPIKWGDGLMGSDRYSNDPNKQPTIMNPAFYQYRWFATNEPVNWSVGATPTVSFLTQYKFQIPAGYSWAKASGCLQISNDDGSTWTTVNGGTIDGNPLVFDGTTAGYGTADAWTTSAHTARYDLAEYVTTTNVPYYGSNPPAGSTWAWASWVPVWMQLESNKGQSFWWDQAFYDSLTPAQQAEYVALYGDGDMYGYYSSPFGYYNVVTAKPFKLRFQVYFPYAPTYWAKDYIFGDLQFKDFEVNNPSEPELPYWTGETGTWAQAIETQRARVGAYESGGYWSGSVTYDVPGSCPWWSWRHGDQSWTGSSYVERTVDRSAMWYSGAGDLGRTSPERTLTLKDPVKINGWRSPTYPYSSYDPDLDWNVPDYTRPVLRGPKVTFQVNHMLQGSDAFFVEGSPDGGANWYPLTRIAPDETATTSLSGSSSSATTPNGWTTLAYYFADPNNAPGSSGQSIWDPANAGSASVKIRLRYLNGSDSAAWGIGISGIEVVNPVSGRTLRDVTSSNPASWISDGWTRGGNPNKTFWSSLWANSQPPFTRSLTLDAMAVPTGSPKLSFMTYYDLSFDEVRVQVSADNGSTWSDLSGTVNGIDNVSVLTGESLTGNDQYGYPTVHGWVPASYDLSAYAGQDVKIKFLYENPYPGSNASGLAVDNVAISGDGGTIFADDAETPKSSWATDYWRRLQGLARLWFESQN